MLPFAECLYNIPYLFSKRNCLKRVFQIFFEKFFARFKPSLSISATEIFKDIFCDRFRKNFYAAFVVMRSVGESVFFLYP